MELNLGIIGFGGMGKWHAKNAARAGVTPVAACDIVPEKVQEAADMGLATYDSAEALLADPRVNIVILTVPNHLHAPMCRLAAKAGKHVISEKPAAMNVAEFDGMVEACRDAGVFFTVHQNRRWDRDMLITKKAYDEGLLGDVFTIESTLHSGNGYMHEWHLYREFGGGMIYDCGVHHIDQLLFLLPGQKITSLYADVRSVLHEEVDDYFKILLKMSGGVTVQLELSTYLLKAQPRWLMGGSKGTLYIKDFGCEGAIYRTGKMLERLPSQIVETVAGPTRQFAPLPPGGIVEEPLPQVQTDWVDFYTNVRGVLENREPSLIRPEEVRRVLGVMEAVRKSAATGQSIALEA